MFITFFFFIGTAYIQIYPLSLHDALPVFFLMLCMVRILFGISLRLRKLAFRSEERRVGKVCRSRWLPYD